jgi:type I restriction enzyme S subunit
VQVSRLIEEGELLINDGYRAKNTELSSIGLPFARAQNVNNGFRFDDDVDRFPEKDLHKVGVKVSQPGDVVFTSKGTVGRFAYVRTHTPSFVYSPQLCFWRSLNHKKLHPQWLFYWMHSREFFEQYSGVAGQTDMAEYVSLRDQRRMHITVPPIDRQRAIACILGSLDDKIELNRRMNRTLEEMARALFKSWFIDFDPVRAKRAVRREHPKWTDDQVSRAACPKLKPEIARLFPDSFEDSELGEIPKGWRVRQLPDVITINPSRSLPKGSLAPYLDMANMPTQGPSPDAWVRREVGSGMKFINGDTLMARITPCLENGKTAFVDFLADGEVGWGSTEYIVLRPKGEIPPLFAYLLARTDEFRTFAIQQMTGSSGRQRVPATSLEKYIIITPGADSPLFKQFGALASPMFDRIREAAKESRTLTALRDTLLPKLVSGELRIPDAERIAARCA